MRLGGGTEKKLVANMGGARGELDWKPDVAVRVLNAMTATKSTGHVDLNIEAIEAEQETGPE